MFGGIVITAKGKYKEILYDLIQTSFKITTEWYKDKLE